MLIIMFLGDMHEAEGEIPEISNMSSLSIAVIEDSRNACTSAQGGCGAVHGHSGLFGVTVSPRHPSKICIVPLFNYFNIIVLRYFQKAKR